MSGTGGAVSAETDVVVVVCVGVLLTVPSPQPVRKNEELAAVSNTVAVSGTGLGDMVILIAGH